MPGEMVIEKDVIKLIGVHCVEKIIRAFCLGAGNAKVLERHAEDGEVGLFVIEDNCSLFASWSWLLVARAQEVVTFLIDERGYIHLEAEIASLAWLADDVDGAIQEFAQISANGQAEAAEQAGEA